MAIINNYKRIFIIEYGNIPILILYVQLFVYIDLYLKLKFIIIYILYDNDIEYDIFLYIYY